MSRGKSYRREETMSGSSSPRKTEKTDRSKESQPESPNVWGWDSCHSSDIASNRSGRVRPSSWDDSDEEVQQKSPDASPKKSRLYSTESADKSKVSIRSEINEIRRQFFQNVENNFHNENVESLGVDRRQSPARVRRRTRSSSSSSPVPETRNQSTPEQEESAEEAETASPKTGSLELDAKCYLNNFFSEIRSKRISLTNENNQEEVTCEETTTTEGKNFEEQDSFYCRTSRKLSQILEVEEMKKENEEKERINEEKRKEQENMLFVKTPKATETTSPLVTARSKNSSGKPTEESQQIKKEPVTFTLPKSLSLEQIEIIKSSSNNTTGSLSERYNIFKYNEREDIIFLTAKSGKTEIGLTKETGWLDWSCQFPSITDPITEDKPDRNLESTKDAEEIQEIFKINTATPRKSKENSYRPEGSSGRSLKSVFELPESPKLKINIDSSRSLKAEDVKNLSPKEKEKEFGKDWETTRNESESSTPNSKNENLQSKKSSSRKLKSSERTTVPKNSPPGSGSQNSVCTPRSSNLNNSSRSQKHSSLREIKASEETVFDSSTENLQVLSSRTKASVLDSAHSCKSTKSLKTKNSIKICSTPAELSQRSPLTLKVEGVALSSCTAEKNETSRSSKSSKSTTRQETSSRRAKADKSVEAIDDSSRLLKSFTDSETNTEVPYPISLNDIKRKQDDGKKTKQVLSKTSTRKNSSYNSTNSERSNEESMIPFELKNENSNSNSFRASSLFDLRIETQSNPSSSNSSCRSASSSRVHNIESRQTSPSSYYKHKKLSPRTLQLEIEKRLESLSRRSIKTPNDEHSIERLKKEKSNISPKSGKLIMMTPSKISSSSSSVEKFLETIPSEIKEKMSIERCSLKTSESSDSTQKSMQTNNSSTSRKSGSEDDAKSIHSRGIMKSLRDFKVIEELIGSQTTHGKSIKQLKDRPHSLENSIDKLTFTDLLREFENNEQDKSETTRSKCDSNEGGITNRKLSIIDEVPVENVENPQCFNEDSTDKICRNVKTRRNKTESTNRISTPENATWSDLIETFDDNDKFPSGVNNFPGFPPKGGKTMISNPGENSDEDSSALPRILIKPDKKSPKKNLREKEYKNFHSGLSKSPPVETVKDNNPTVQQCSQMIFVDLNQFKAFGIGEFGDVTCWNVDKTKIIESEQPKGHGDGSQTSNLWHEISLSPESSKKGKENKAVPRQLWTEVNEGFLSATRKKLDNLETYFASNNVRVTKSEDCLVAEAKPKFGTHPRDQEPHKLSTEFKKKKQTELISKSTSDELSGNFESGEEDEGTLEYYDIHRKHSVSMYNLDLQLQDPTERTNSLTHLFYENKPRQNEQKPTRSNRSLEKEVERSGTADCKNKWLTVGGSDKSKKAKKNRRKSKKGFILLKENSYGNEKDFLRTEVPPLKLRNSNCLRNFYKRVINVFCLTSDSSVATSN